MDTQKIIVLCGPNASGKTRYVEQMRRQMASDTVRYMAFCDSYGAQTDRAYYLQLRWNQHDIDQETPTAGELLERNFRLTGPDTAERRLWQQHLYRLFELEPLLGQYVILLSSGELRKMQMAKVLLARPSTLIIDNPFIGLDSDARDQLRRLISLLAHEQGLCIWLVVARESDIPDDADQVVRFPLERNTDDAPYPPLPQAQGDTADSHREVVAMRNVSIRYGQRTILSDLNWTVCEGERWALSGRNGSGKSTLLSLICADNPQAYACDISLFGRQRGSGETIWDIKRRIGYVSPEMHRSYQRPLPALQVVASGLKDTVGLYTRTNDAERRQCLDWMRVFRIEELARRPFTSLSSGEQRLVLLARAFVKDPELIILDEPFHGLDDFWQHHVRLLIDRFCLRPGKTLIMVTHYEEELPSCINRHLSLNTKNRPVFLAQS